MKRLIILAALAVLSACGPMPNGTADQQAAQQTKALAAEAQSQIGLPRVANFTEKRLATKLAEMRDQPNLVTYAYVQGIDGKLTCFGKGIGFGIPYSAQLTNPERIVGSGETHYSNDMSLPQPEPNGLFMPDSASATWYMLIDPKSGEASPVYVEPNLTVSVHPLTGPAISAPCPA